MAKRKRMTGNSEANSGLPIDAAAFVQNAINETSAKLNRMGAEVIDAGPLFVLPVPSLAMRWVLQNEGWLMSKVSVISGQPKSFKSFFAIEVGRWHALCNGYIFRCEAESKENEDFYYSLLRGLEARMPPAVWCRSLDDWQRHIVFTTKNLQKQFSLSDGPGKTIPVCEIVDSLTGLASESTIKNVEKDGFASKHFPDEARAIADFLRSFPQKLVGWPFSFIGVNHVKKSIDPQGFVQERGPGGIATVYQLAMDLRLNKFGRDEVRNDCVIKKVAISTVLNGFGNEGKMTQVPIKFWNREVDGVPILHGKFEWHVATTLLLTRGLGMNTSDKDIYLPLIKDIAGIREKPSGKYGILYWSKVLDVPSDNPISASAIGELLEKRPDVLSQLYSLLGIARRRFFPPAIEYLKYKQGYEHIVAQAASSEDFLIRRSNCVTTQPDLLLPSSVAEGADGEQEPAVMDDIEVFDE